MHNNNWFQKISYNREIGYLKNYLRSGIDPFDFAYMVPFFLDSQSRIQELNNSDDSDEFVRWLYNASPEDLSDFKEWLKENSHDFIDIDDVNPYDQPVYMNMEYIGFIKPTWLVHFTNDAASIQKEGFTFGHPEFDGLHSTIWKFDRYQEPGYNFAFLADYSDAEHAAQSGTYGNEAVVFWGAGIETVHYEDEEHQIVVWGPSVDKDKIYPLYNKHGIWYTEAANGRDITTQEGTFESMVDWIIQNHRMLDQIKNKEERRKKSRQAYSSRKRFQKIAQDEKLRIDLTDQEKYIFDFIRQASQLANPPVTARVAGGWVRDKLLGLPSKDIDVSVDTMTGQEFAQLLVKYEKQRLQQRLMPALKSTDMSSVGIKQGKDPGEKISEDDIGQQDPQVAFLSIFGEEIEILNLRAGEEYEEGKHMLLKSEFGSPKEDAYRRDLTINSLFYNINTNKVEDYTGYGIKDLLGENIVLRVPINTKDKSMSPGKTFKDDPLRILRVIRFLSRYENAIIEPETYEAMQNPQVIAHLYRRVHNEQEPLGISPERVAIEFRKMMQSNRPEEAVRTMWDLGLLQGLFNLPKDFIEDMNMDQQSSYHDMGVLDHTLEVMKHANNLAQEFGLDQEERMLINMAALFHDVGKLDPKTHIVQDKDGHRQVSYYGKKEKQVIDGIPTRFTIQPSHEESSAEQWERFAKSLKLTNKEIDVVADYIAGHMEPHKMLRKRHLNKVIPGQGIQQKTREKLNLYMQENPKWKMKWLLSAADALGKREDVDEKDAPYRNMIAVMENIVHERPAEQQEKISAPLNGHDLIRIMSELDVDISPKPPRESELPKGYIWILQQWLIEEAASRNPNNPLTVQEAEELVRSPEWMEALHQLYNKQHPTAEFSESGLVRLPSRPNANIENDEEELDD